jgi:hypothetical protein
VRPAAITFRAIALATALVAAPAGAQAEAAVPSSSISGSAYGSSGIARSPIALEELERLKRSVLFTAEDEASLRLAGDVLADQTEAILDVWYGFVASNPHLVATFAPEGGPPDAAYLAAVRRRFGQWILDTCRRPYDQAWLDWQEEIALRHHRAKKNRTDGVDAAPIVPQRYLVALIYPITATIRPFLEKKGHPPDVVERMHQAWFKSVVLQVALWSRPYVRDGDY